MDKIEFLSKLRNALSGLPEADIEERISFYSEMIDDRMEDGLSFEDAIKELGSIEDIRAETIKSTPLVKIIAEKIKPVRKVKLKEMLLIILGSPIWASLAIVALAVAITLYAVLWSVIISLWAIFASFAVCAPVGIIAFAILALNGNVAGGLFILGCGLFVGGLVFPVFYGCRYITSVTILLTKKIITAIKNCFIKKEG